ncbi:hypothetical protein Acsp02_10400 [Actinoplanes sp. NBRC 103695]|nr:hypothetical protein Acsp02_10400 [Actinoplanes sp. NBRC 103695]
MRSYHSRAQPGPGPAAVAVSGQWGRLATGLGCDAAWVAAVAVSGQWGRWQPGWDPTRRGRWQ